MSAQDFHQGLLIWLRHSLVPIFVQALDRGRGSLLTYNWGLASERPLWRLSLALTRATPNSHGFL